MDYTTLTQNRCRDEARGRGLSFSAVKGQAPGGHVLALVPLPDDPVEALHGMLEAGPLLTKDLLIERAQERAREEDDRG